MNKKRTSVLPAAALMIALLLFCALTATAEESTYTYRGTYSSVSTWSPTDWEISSEYDMLGYAATAFYGFWMNETQDGYDIVCELAAEFPVDVTAAYAGDETYGVPADAAQGYAWQVKLREDAVWEDGTPITAHDVEYTLQQFLNPGMKNYRASLFYQGGTALANAEDYYNSDKAGGVRLTNAAELGLSYDALAAGEDGQYADASGNRVYIAWTKALDWLGGYSLLDYWSYMPQESYDLLSAQADADGYIPATTETLGALYAVTGGDDWGNEPQSDLVNYLFCENGVMEATTWAQVGYVQDDEYTFTLVLKNPTSLFDFEMNVDNLILVKENLYEANKKETGGILKSAYGTGVDKFSSYGPYKFVSYQESKEIVFTKNES